MFKLGNKLPINEESSSSSTPLSQVAGYKTHNNNYDDDNLSINELNLNNNNNNVKKCSLPLRVIGVQENSCIAFSPLDNRFAFISGNGSIYITKESEHSFEIENVLVGHSHQVNCLLFHPSEPILVSGGFDGIIIWDYLKGYIIKKIATHKDQDSHDSRVEALTWLYDGTSLVSGSKDSTIKIWDFISFSSSSSTSIHLLETISAHKAPVTCFYFCKNTNLLASAGRDSSVKIWDVSTLKPEQRSKRLDDSSIKVALNCTLDGHMGDVVSMVFNKEGSMLFSGARDNEIKVWDVKKQEELRSIKFNKGEVTSMELLSKDSSILMTSSIDGSIKSIKLAKVTSIGLNDVLQIEELSKETQIIENSINSPSLIDTSSSNLMINDYSGDNEKDKILYSYEPYDSVGIASMRISQNGSFMATSSDRSVRIWKLQPNNYTDKPQLFHEFVGHRGPVNSVKLLSTNSELLISGSTDYNIFIYNLKTMRREAVFNFEGSVYTLCVASSLENNQQRQQTIIFVGGNHYDIKGYCIQSPNEPEQLMREVVRFTGHSGKVKALSINPDSTLMVSGGDDFDILVWNLKLPYHYRGGDESTNQLQKPLNKYSYHKGHITDICFNFNGKLLASCATDHSIIIYNVSGNKVSRFLTIEQAHQSVVSSVAFGLNQSQQYLFSACWEGTIKIWDLSNPKKANKSINEFKAHSSRISSLKVSEDGELLIVSFSNGHIKTFSTQRPWNLITEYIPNDNTSCNCISSNSSIIVSGSDNGMIRCWPINPQ